MRVEAAFVTVEHAGAEAFGSLTRRSAPWTLGFRRDPLFSAVIPTAQVEAIRFRWALTHMAVFAPGGSCDFTGLPSRRPRSGREPPQSTALVGDREAGRMELLAVAGPGRPRMGQAAAAAEA